MTKVVDLHPVSEQLTAVLRHLLTVGLLMSLLCDTSSSQFTTPRSSSPVGASVTMNTTDSPGVPSVSINTTDITSSNTTASILKPVTPRADYTTLSADSNTSGSTILSTLNSLSSSSEGGSDSSTPPGAETGSPGAESVTAVSPTVGLNTTGSTGMTTTTTSSSSLISLFIGYKLSVTSSLVISAFCALWW